MLYFFDRKVEYVEYDKIVRQELLDYFLDGHMKDVVCVFDTAGRYMGLLTYRRMMENVSIDDALEKYYLVLDKDIWENARRLSILNRPTYPVVDSEGRLISFAYQDTDANRELRQLRELREEPEALQFKDLYPECGCVRIYGFNELAYFFVEYLRGQGIPVQVAGRLWEGLFESDDIEMPDYQCMDIYAEGTWQKPENWRENLLRSVSVEFECIDKIYEENIRRGLIKAADGDCNTLIGKLKKAENVAILGTDMEAQDAYDFLLKNGVEAVCFTTGGYVSNRKLFGKPVLELAEIYRKYEKKIAFVGSRDKGSAWGIGATDYYDYIGYRRNEEFFLLKDYVEIEGDSLKTALTGQDIVMVGDVYLCERLYRYFEENSICTAGHMRYMVLPEEDALEDVSQPCTDFGDEKRKKDMPVLLVIPQLFLEGGEQRYEDRKSKIVSCLTEGGYTNYIDYFSHTLAFIRMENKGKYGELRPKRIVLGAINDHSGNYFFRGILDGHPSVMRLNDSYFNTNLFWYCVRLAGKNAKDVLRLFDKMYGMERENDKFKDEERFRDKLRELLAERNSCTSQELFVIFHVAYMYMHGEDIGDLCDMIIYFEPHCISRDTVERYSLWIGVDGCACDILNMSRNICMVTGSRIKDKKRWGGVSISNLQFVTSMENVEQEEYSNARRLVIRFEDLKLHPREELQKLCDGWNIPWSESLMEVTNHGRKFLYDNGKRKIQDFDLGPVYDQYEEYLSEFDRLRISIINVPYQKKYGYPYVSPSFFSRRELQEMFLKEWRVEKEEGEIDREIRLEFFINQMHAIRHDLQKVRID